MGIQNFYKIIAILLLACGCNYKTTYTVPEWSKKAVWYQIFVERFRNGDPSNDPSVKDITGAYPDNYPEDWSITPWGHDWYAHEPWLDKIKGGNFHAKIQARRYGGDLQGVLDKIDYLDSLGITAIYFNPLNDSPSLHKYDARTYTHIDRNFGPDPEGDSQLMESETPDDPATWKWTSADRLFLKVVEEFHKRGIKVIIDYSWNHTGKEFWALKDIREKGPFSKYADWYNIISYDNPATPENEFRYEGWGGRNIYMPVFRKDIIPPDDTIMPFEGNLHSSSLRKHIFDVTRRWLDPDGNGDPSDGVDGFRLDVAAEIPMGFWREYRKVVREINPEAYLVGEIWWLKWPDQLLDPAPFMGEQFDAIMNYRWFRVARGFFAQAEPVLTPSEFVEWIKKLNVGIPAENQMAMMNVAGTHDSPRLSTSFYNKTLDKYRAKPSENPDYKINKPDSITLLEQKMFLVHQFTFTGAPHIWYGEEVGMWGADDPDCRKPMVWNDIVYEVERTHFYPDKIRPADTVKPDHNLNEFYKKMIKLRKENPVLVYGDLDFLIADDNKMILAYSREKGSEEIITIFNRSGSEQTVMLPVRKKALYIELFPDNKKDYKTNNKNLIINIKPLSAIVLKRVGT
ncbi:MAG TPA: glycoside hydrolase family 13 protein [Bacteroidales bacterium]|nr:glycoside hydrolase family 13 protein [Bacteroidales bacterium]HOK73805.1 glycoside hydrolase family 13 protein [Bacteroidales bacterium]HOM40061.1 glycoside hydrolase family 13 protein [Bacteroidales bacterium]HOU29886.1 glycoside hydrolase family 13 protein [Bacteroidales bacterium]HPP91754.1 glycoside hydrolase family 13 protein [Bacteroidales bacterium]